MIFNLRQLLRRQQVTLVVEKALHALVEKLGVLEVFRCEEKDIGGVGSSEVG